MDQELRLAPEMCSDPRIRVFRRTLNGLDDFEGMEVDAYVVLGERYIVVLDTLLCPSDMATVLHTLEPEMRGRQIFCVNSHADWDHSWGNGYFSGEQHVPIIAHEYCQQRLNSESARQKLADYQARYPVFHAVKLVPPTITFNTQLHISAGNLTIELLHAPGHCRDQIVAWLPETRLLLAFDAVEKPLPCIADSACVPLMFATLQRLAALDAQCVLCSHGRTTSPALIQENLIYLRDIERRTRSVLAHHAPTDQDLQHVAEFIGYPFDEVLATTNEEVDRTYYSWAHEHNIRAILGWLLTQ